MANLPNIEETIIATGYNCHVRVGKNAADAAGNIIGMVASFQANESFQLQEAVCIGNLGPISIDPQGYTCSITVDGFLPAKRVMDGKQLYADGGKKAIMDYVPDRAKFMTEDGDLPKIAYLDFYNKQSKTILCSFSGVLISDNGVSADGNSYVKNNVQMRALSWNKD
jgi:hypothetical protein